MVFDQMTWHRAILKMPACGPLTLPNSFFFFPAKIWRGDFLAFVSLVLGVFERTTNKKLPISWSILFTVLMSMSPNRFMIIIWYQQFWLGRSDYWWRSLALYQCVSGILSEFTINKFQLLPILICYIPIAFLLSVSYWIDTYILPIFGIMSYYKYLPWSYYKWRLFLYHYASGILWIYH